jgi:nickel-type superoxide dismutase maturation protease
MRRWRGLAGLLLACGALLLIARRELDVVEVRGRSMAPTLLPGDRLLVVRLRRPPLVGEIVLARDPRLPRRELVKRVAGVGDGVAILRGDNRRESTDARSFGPLPTTSIRWRALLRYWPVRQRKRERRLRSAPVRATSDLHADHPGVP